MKNTIYLILLLLTSQQFQAQITYIPDPVFEQFLIYHNIDSDGIVNGQVLTSDIESLTELIIDGWGRWGDITDLTGIQDFTALEKLAITFSSITTLDVTKNLLLRELNCGSNNLTTLNLSSNKLLEVLYCGNYGIDVGPFIAIEELDLTNNPNIKFIDSYDTTILKKIKLKNQNNNANMSIVLLLFAWNFTHPDYDPNEIRNTVCIEVDDPYSAQNNQYPYSEWNLNIDTHVAVNFSENCTFSTPKNNLKNILVYPNPATNTLYLESSESIDKIILLDSSGKKVLEQSYTTKNIAVSQLPKGVYILRVFTGNFVHTEKILIQ